jgi:hypothetical protein
MCRGNKDLYQEICLLVHEGFFQENIVELSLQSDLFVSSLDISGRLMYHVACHFEG